MFGNPVAFYIVTVVALASALGVIISRNAVYSALSLVAHLASLAVFFLLLNSLFLAVVQLLVYTGAIMVLFLFVVTMLAPDEKESLQADRLRWQIIPAFILGLLLLGGIGYGIYKTPLNPLAKTSGTDSLSHQLAVLGGSAEAFGEALFHGFLFPFEVTSLLLVVAIIGSLVLGRRMLRNKA